MGYDERDSRGFPKRWTGLAAAGTNQATALLLLDGGYHEFTTVGSGSGVSLPVIMPWSREITISNNGAHALLVYPPSGGTISAGAANASVSLPAGSSATYWATSPTNWQDRVTGGSGGGGGGSSTITEVSQTASFAASAGAFYAISGPSAVTATLPTAVGLAGQTIRIRCVSGYTGLCTIRGTSGQTIGPASATSQILYAGESALLQSDGANWARTGGTIIPCSCRLTLGTDQSITQGTPTVVRLNTVSEDNSGLMGIAASASNEITIFRPGRYLCTGSFYFGALTASQNFNIRLQILKNGASITILAQIPVSSSTSTVSQNVSFTAMLVLAAGDLLTLECLQLNAGNNAETISAGPVTCLHAVEVPSW